MQTTTRQPTFIDKFDAGLIHIGNFIKRHQRLIFWIQMAIVLLYATLIIVPIFVPLPGNSDHILTHITVFAQFVFWGIWWPFVLLSMVLFGRIWCGVLCPEGALSEWASHYSLKKATPRWLRWGGWPTVAFAGTTIYGQMVSVYQYPLAVLLVLGGSTAAAIVVGFLFARKKRIWCRYLCPVNGVFQLLSKLAPIHYKVDQQAWEEGKRLHPEKNIAFNCAPLVHVRNMQGNTHCHMCSRCSDYRGAVELTRRPITEEVVQVDKENSTGWQSFLLIFGLLGLAIGAFHWTVSPYMIQLKIACANFLIDHNIMWPLATNTPWFIFTNYPEQNDVFSWLDGFLVVFYIVATGIIMASIISALLAISCLAIKQNRKRFFIHFSQSLIPIAGVGVFLGLSATTVNILRYDGFHLYWINNARLALLVVATLFSFYLAAKITAFWQLSKKQTAFTLFMFALVLAVIDCAWGFMFWWW
ncbi:4Fe-4S binding protein [Brackiella oedipodis]|uniref:4Fe-4S binding protein n=1 Tax=Brackiella oedipodis TaxID=124225 RepID=UPI000A0216E2|nr:4Fe-4S binding protein [Brackiella oedipodis]